MIDQTPLSVILEIVNNDLSLNAEEKQKYVLSIEQISSGKAVGEEAFTELSEYLDNVIFQSEEEALLNEDPEEIERLADIRNSRNELEGILFQLKSANTPVGDQPSTGFTVGE